MKFLTAIYFCGVMCTLISAESGNLDSTIAGRVEEYDKKLSSFLREILENFREEMHEGMPDIGIPPVDPLMISNIDELISNQIVNLTLRMRGINITGISNFKINYLKADLQRGFANFSIFLSNLQTEGYCYMDGIVLGIFPLRSNGPFQINVTEVNIAAYGSLNVSMYEKKTRINMDDLKLNLTFGPLDVEFKSLLGGAKWTQVLIRILTVVGRRLFINFHDEAMTKLGRYLKIVINDQLDKGTLVDLLDHIHQTTSKDPEVWY